MLRGFGQKPVWKQSIAIRYAAKSHCKLRYSARQPLELQSHSWIRDEYHAYIKSQLTGFIRFPADMPIPLMGFRLYRREGEDSIRCYEGDYGSCAHIDSFNSSIGLIPAKNFK